MMNIHTQIEKITGINELYDFFPIFTEVIMRIAKAQGGALNMVVDEYGFIKSFEANNRDSVKNKYLDRFCVVTFNSKTTYDDSLRDKSFNIEALVDNLEKGSSFRFLFEGKTYSLYDNERYIISLIKKGYLTKKYLENAKKNYEKYAKDEKFKYRYPTLSHYIEKITIPLKYENNIYGFITLDQIKRKNKKRAFSRTYLKTLEFRTNQLAKKLYEKIKSINDELIETILHLEILKENLNYLEHPSFTYSHCNNVAVLYYDFMRELNRNGIVKLKTSDKLALKIGALFHDIGKISIPPEILNKPTKLTIEEFEIIKQHPVIGYDILKGLNLPENTYKLILYHHEKLDGAGYPYLLKGDEIPKIVQAFTIIDIFEALIGKRPYKKELSVEEALKVLKEMANSKKLSSELVEYFEKYVRETIIKEDIGSYRDQYLDKIKEYLNSKFEKGFDIKSQK